MATIRIAQDRFGNWGGFHGTRKVRWFESEHEAKGWLADKMVTYVRENVGNGTCNLSRYSFKFTGRMW